MSRRVFVFNGDADGLCALQQLLLVEGGAADELITGPKRRTALLREARANPGDQVTVLDVSLAANRADVDRLLAAGCRVRYFDHHDPGELPQDPGFEAHIDGSPAVCTSVIVDRHLQGAQRIWAVVGAFGDNLDETADALADCLEIEERRAELRKLGIALNYNSYGESERDLFFTPHELHARMIRYPSPFRFMLEDLSFERIWSGYCADLAQASALAPVAATPRAAVFVLPDAAWARRVNGVFANRCARDTPGRAHAVLSPNASKGMTVSVRAPLDGPTGASDFCRTYPGGGGRAGAAGINNLPKSEVERFASRFLDEFGIGGSG
jgi:hypothetical protein